MNTNVLLTPPFAPVLQYLDQRRNFAYLQFTNRTEQMNINVSHSFQSVIIIDTRTKYFNATKLVEQFGATNGNLTVQKILHNKAGRSQLMLIEQALNIQGRDDLEEYTHPNYNREEHEFKAMYDVPKTKQNSIYCGTYTHYALLSLLLISVNPFAAVEVSNWLFTYFVIEGLDESRSLFDSTYQLTTEAEQINQHRKALVRKLETGEMIPEDALSDPTFDMIQHKKAINYARDITNIERIKEDGKPKRTHKKKEPSSVNVREAVLLIAHYDKEGQFCYGSDTYKITIERMNEDDVNDYIDALFKPEKHNQAELLAELNSGIRYFPTSIVGRYFGLYLVPPSIATEFVEARGELFDMHPESFPNDSRTYLVTSDIDAFKQHFSEFVVYYQRRRLMSDDDE